MMECHDFLKSLIERLGSNVEGKYNALKDTHFCVCDLNVEQRTGSAEEKLIFLND